MDEYDSKPSLAAGMAKRSVWVVLAGGLLSFVCRLDVFSYGVQGLLVLPAVTLLLIGLVFAAVALIRITSEDRGAVLMPGIWGIVLSITFAISLSRWTDHAWENTQKRAAMRASQTVIPRTQVVVTRPAASASVAGIKYELPAMDAIMGLAAKTRADAALLKGEDAAVLRAWAAHLEALHSACTNAGAAAGKLHAANLLDPNAITDFSDTESARRRFVANGYSDTWREFERAVSTFPGSFRDELSREVVSPERAGAELSAIIAFVRQPEPAARITALQRLCHAEIEVGLGYNYACSQVFDYARFAKISPQAAANSKPQMETQVAKLRQSEQVAAEARREALGQK